MPRIYHTVTTVPNCILEFSNSSRFLPDNKKKKLTLQDLTIQMKKIFSKYYDFNNEM